MSNPRPHIVRSLICFVIMYQEIEPTYTKPMPNGPAAYRQFDTASTSNAIQQETDQMMEFRMQVIKQSILDHLGLLEPPKLNRSQFLLPEPLMEGPMGGKGSQQLPNNGARHHHNHQILEPSESETPSGISEIAIFGNEGKMMDKIVRRIFALRFRLVSLRRSFLYLCVYL